jgi:hypothetical protein
MDHSYNKRPGSFCHLIVPAFLVLLQGCAVFSISLQYNEASLLTHSIKSLPVTIRYLPRDASVLPLLEDSIRHGLERTGLWGELRSPITVTVYPNHQSLEEALHKKGYKWLKAWATEEEIFLQSPRSWPVVRKKNFFDLMTHELTHVLHFQIAGVEARRLGGQSGDIGPFWFSEGLASYTADQRYRRYSRKKLLKKLEAKPGFDPLSPTEKDVRDHEKLTYSSAHYLVTYLIRTYGEEKIRDLIETAAQGRPFQKAFEKTYPVSLMRFRREWKRWLGAA